MSATPLPPGSGDIARILATPHGQEAVGYIVLKLNQMANDADCITSSQQGAAEGTSSPARRAKYEEIAEFHQALAAVVRHSIGILQHNLPGVLPGFPGPAGTTWSDADGDRWVMCEDGHFRLLGRDGAVKPDEVARLYGPMTLVGGA